MGKRYSFGLEVIRCGKVESGQLVTVEPISEKKLQKGDIVLSYLTGGIGVSTHVLFIRYKGGKIIDLWNAVSFDHLKSRNQIISFVKKNKKKPSYLHPNFDI